MVDFSHALGHGPDGASYRPPVPRKRTAADRTKAWLWYRWGIGRRPAPKFEPETRADQDGRHQR